MGSISNYVKEQNLPTGEIVLKGKVIGVVAEEYRSSKAAIANFEEAVGSEKRDFIGQFCNTDVMLFNDNLGEEGRIGHILTDIKIIDAILACDKYGVCYTDYDLQDGVIIFRNIPSSEQYKLIVRAEGFVEDEFWIDLSWYDRAYMPMDLPMTLNLLPSDAKFEMSNGLSFVDHNKEFLPWTEILIRWPTEDNMDADVWRAYTTNEFGRFPYLIYLNKDYTIDLAISDKNGNLHTLGEQLLLKKAADEDAVDYYIQLKGNGELYVMTEDEFWE